MSADWVTSVDMLADAGIINFDAAAYVTGSKPRYIGNLPRPIDQMPSLNLGLPDDVLSPLQADVYNPLASNNSPAGNNSPVKNPAWKKMLFGALSIGGIIWGIKTLSKNPVKALNAGGGKVKTFFVNSWNSFAGIFKKKP